MIVTNGECTWKERWNLDCATTSHIHGDRQICEPYMEYTKWDGQEICDFASTKAGKAMGHGDVQLRLQLPGGRKHKVVVRNFLHAKGAFN